MTWDYAELSKKAKSVGGPEKLVDVLVDAGKGIGHKEMLPIVGIAFGLGAFSYAGIQKVAKYCKRKAEISPETVQRAKEELVQGIKDYEENHPEIDCADCDVSKECEPTKDKT